MQTPNHCSLRLEPNGAGDQRCLNPQIKYTDKRGFYLLIPSQGPEGSEVLQPFVVVQRKGRLQTQCTTPELQALNTRLQSAHNNCMILTLQAALLSSPCISNHDVLQMEPSDVSRVVCTKSVLRSLERRIMH